MDESGFHILINVIIKVKHIENFPLKKFSMDKKLSCFQSSGVNPKKINLVLFSRRFS
jgi:hypothetical protein